jgi:hypothetical protein
MSSANDAEPVTQALATQALAVGVKKGAPMIGVSVSTMWALIRQGKVPTWKVGNRTLLRVRDLEALSAGGNVEIDQPAAKPEEVRAKVKRAKPARAARSSR